MLILKKISVFRAAFIILFLAIIIVPSESVSANHSAGDTTLYRLPEIVVTTRRILLPHPNIVLLADENDFIARNAHNVAEAISPSSGINIQTSSSGGARVLVRSFRHRDVLILFDGIPISSAYEGALDLNELSIGNVTHVKMIKDAPSVIYGTNAMGGVIDIIPKTGLICNSSVGAVEIGDFESYLIRANVGRKSKFVSYFISTKYESSNGYSLSNDFTSDEIKSGDRRENSDYSRGNIFLHLNSKFRPIGTSSLFLYLSESERGIPPQVGASDPDYERLTDSKRLTLGWSNNFTFAPLSLKLFYNRYQSEESLYEDSSYTKIDEVNAATDFSYGTMLYSKFFASPSNLLIFNLSFKNDEYINDSDPANPIETTARTYTLAVENELSIKRRLSLAIGGLFSLFEKTRISSNSTALNGQISVCFQINRKLALYASNSYRTRFPNLKELYRDKYGNPDLHEQKANNYEFGFNFNNTQKIRTNLALFYNKLIDLIERKTRETIYENLEKVAYKGFELSSGGWLAEGFLVRLGYTFIQANEEIHPIGNVQLRRVPKHNLNLELQYKLPLRLLTAVNGIYVAELFDLDAEQQYTRLSNYVVINAKASILLKNYIEAYAAVKNILDENYSTRVGYPREGQSFRLGLSIGSIKINS